MKSKLLFFTSFFFFSFFYFPCLAQKYQPMAIEGAHWIVQHDHENTLWGPDKIFSFTIRGDSIWQDKTYKKVYIEFFRNDGMGYFPRPYEVINSFLWALIRDEPIERKVYVIYEIPDDTYCTPHTEVLLYDFSLTKEDEITGCSAELFIHPFEPKPLIIDSVSLINYEDAERKVLHSEGAFPIDELAIFEPINFIEGIGIQDWGIFFYFFSPGNGFSGLADYCIGTDADCGIITSIEENLYKQGFSIYPTLIEDDSFWIESNLPNISLRVYDLVGREVAAYANIHSNKELIELGNLLDKGVYVVKVVDSQNQILGTERIIVY